MAAVPDQLDVGLALSGGGYRAMLFSLGSLWRLNELGWLRKLDIVTSVSGGSILNGVLATRWAQLQWDGAVATNFIDKVAQPVMAMAAKTVDVAAGIEGIVSILSTISDKVVAAYDKDLFNGATLQRDVPAFEKGRTPRFLFYSTSLQTGSSVRIERKRLADYKIGEIPNPDLPVARVVAASSAFPPVLSPVTLKLDPATWQKFDGAGLFGNDAFKKQLQLTDGGVYDNMGLEAIWDRCSTVLVCDAGAPLDLNPEPHTDWTRQAMRVLDIVTEQTRALRKRTLVQAFQQAEAAGGAATGAGPGRKGAYWGITTLIGDYGVASPMTADNALTGSLQNIRTRLNEFKPDEQGHLVNWGYVLADAAMRRYVEKAGAAPTLWPVPKFPLT
jgi:NTE family protein